MKLSDMKRKVLALIEELDPDHPLLTPEADLAAKMHAVIGQVAHELARIKKLPRYFEMAVSAGQTLDFDRLEMETGNEIYQICSVRGAAHRLCADGTVIRVLADGVMEIECYVYPTEITDNTPDTYQFELPQDVLEIMPYGVAADLLRSDVACEYGRIWAERYETLLSRLDPRWQTLAVRAEGGVSI